MAAFSIFLNFINYENELLVDRFMKNFDEILLKSELSKLDGDLQFAFGLAVSSRLLLNFEYYADIFSIPNKERPREINKQLWGFLRNPDSNQQNFPSLSDEILTFLPEENDQWTIWHSLADDALSSLAYTINYLTSSNTQEIVWAARRAYESADQFVIKILDISFNDPASELLIKSHSIVQAELCRQQRDLDLLTNQQDKKWSEDLYTFAIDEVLIEEENLKKFIP